jgi:hypothetical protein
MEQAELQGLRAERTLKGELAGTRGACCMLAMLRVVRPAVDAGAEKA